MQDGLQAMVARIDERTEHIQEDVKDLKVGLAKVVDTVNAHSTQLSAIEEKVKNSNNGLSRRQMAGIGGGAGAAIGGAIAFLIEWFKH
jgi:hypothetical protein